MSDKEMSPHMTSEMSPQLHVRREREPRTEPRMLRGLRVMEKRKAAKKEQLLFQTQARREARSRAVSDAAEAAKAELMLSDDSNDDDSFDLDEEYPPTQLRYMERKYRREQGLDPKTGMPLSDNTVKEQLDNTTSSSSASPPAEAKVSAEASAEASVAETVAEEKKTY